MSLDYPFYEELCRLKHRSAWWWLIGDRLYYLGLLPAVLSVGGGAAAFIAGLVGLGWYWLLMAVVTFIVGTGLFVIGGSLKRYAYDLAERDGISAAEVYSRGASGQGLDARPLAPPDQSGE
jgi:hypothetical protein